MSTASIQSAINQGYALTGQALGSVFQQYRPSGSTAALAEANLIGTVTAAFAQNGNFNKPGKVGNDEWWGYYDATSVQPGDYFGNGAATYFVAAQQPLLPYLTVKCERVVTVSALTQAGTGGLQPYGGDVLSNETPLLTQWPASIVQGSRGERGDITLPQDVRDPNWTIRLPLTPGIVLEASYIVTDDLARRYIISSAELSDYGWRLSVRQAEA